MSLANDLKAEFTDTIEDAGVKAAVRAFYDRLGSHISGSQPQVRGEALTGTINGSNATFTTAANFKPENVSVFVNGIRQKIVDDYQLIGNNTVQFTFSPNVGEHLTIDY